MDMPEVMIVESKMEYETFAITDRIKSPLTEQKCISVLKDSDSSSSSEGSQFPFSPKLLTQDQPNIRITSTKQLKLNVGGFKYSTTLTTLTADPDSMLAAMFSGRFPVEKNEEGEVFIDRDGRYFNHIINWLRNGTIPTIESAVEREALLIEARYFQITSLMEFLLGLEVVMQTNEEKIKEDNNRFSIKELLQLVNGASSRRKLQLASANLSELKLDGICLSGSNLKFANMDHATLQYSNFAEAICQGASFNFADLQNADFSLCQLNSCQMQNAKLSNANLQGANLAGADMTGCDLQGANLQGANLQGAILQGANVQYTNLFGAKLQGASLHGIINVHHAKGLKR